MFTKISLNIQLICTNVQCMSRDWHRLRDSVFSVNQWKKLRVIWTPWLTFGRCYVSINNALSVRIKMKKDLSLDSKKWIYKESTLLPYTSFVGEIFPSPKRRGTCDLPSVLIDSVLNYPTPTMLWRHIGIVKESIKNLCLHLFALSALSRALSPS